MKRSELKRQLVENGFSVTGYTNSGPVSDTLAEEILGELETRSGFLWDPEKEPLPERLEVYCAGVGALTHACLSPASNHWVFTLVQRPSVALPQVEDLRRRVFAEAVRRYNAWPNLRVLANRLQARERSHHVDAGWPLCNELFAILDGKEEKS